MKFRLWIYYIISKGFYFLLFLNTGRKLVGEICTNISISHSLFIKKLMIQNLLHQVTFLKSNVATHGRKVIIISLQK